MQPVGDIARTVPHVDGQDHVFPTRRTGPISILARVADRHVGTRQRVGTEADRVAHADDGVARALAQQIDHVIDEALSG